jgi:hypothetical protein
MVGLALQCLPHRKEVAPWPQAMLLHVLVPKGLTSALRWEAHRVCSLAHLPVTLRKWLDLDTKPLSTDLLLPGRTVDAPGRVAAPRLSPHPAPVSSAGRTTLPLCREVTVPPTTRGE